MHPTTPAGGHDDLTLHAWVDESMHIQQANGTYLLTAVIADTTACETLRDAMLGLRERNNAKLHWNVEGARRRRAICAVVAQLDVAAVVVVGTPLDQKKQERARRCCLETLLPHLSAADVTQVWLEARTPDLNRKDLRYVEAMRGARQLGPELRVGTARPLEEPMLWLPDVVGGAVGAARAGNTSYLAAIGTVVTQITATVR